MILKGSELAALGVSSVSLVALTVGMTAGIMSGSDSERKASSSTVEIADEENRGMMRYELWDAFQACKNQMREEGNYQLANTFMDSHSSRYNEKKNLNEIYMSADVYKLKDGIVTGSPSAMEITCQVSAKSNQVEKFKTRAKRG